MNRAYVICHMTTSIDGKVTGEFLMHPRTAKATELYYELNRSIKADGFACGRVTMEGSFTGGWYPNLEEYEPLKVGELGLMNFMMDDMEPPYALAFDPHGRLGWKSNRIIDPDGDPGYDNARIIEVLTEQADLRYLSYLEAMEIPYIIAGENEIDLELVLFYLKNAHGVNRILLEGGSILNGAFQRAGVVDELSLVVAPVIADDDGKPLFTDSAFDEYSLAEVQNHDGILWLNYKREAE